MNNVVRVGSAFVVKCDGSLWPTDKFNYIEVPCGKVSPGDLVIVLDVREVYDRVLSNTGACGWILKGYLSNCATEV